MADCYGGADGTKEQKKTFKFSDSRTGETLCVVIPELGAGTALPGVVAAKCGAQVTLSDNALSTQCLRNCEQSCEVNGLENVKVIGLTWGQFTLELTSLQPVDVILGSDCFYDKKDFEDIIVTVSFLLEKNLGSQFWCTYQQRSSDWSIAHLLENWKLTCEHVPLTCFAAETPHLAGSNLPGDHTIHLLIIKKVNNRVTKSFT
ncbi:histone-arginine methyltransferase METTL23-like isoform X2 [Liolophura sinensis]|uniref:histone-arginine methyltransferase METTL23-like isoform X2 n=1 Tax=Liolophura sinensis TaxID=3198878 RepID=UPI0031583BA0